MALARRDPGIRIEVAGQGDVPVEGGTAGKWDGPDGRTMGIA
jgi:hypothetical protein